MRPQAPWYVCAQGHRHDGSAWWSQRGKASAELHDALAVRHATYADENKREGRGCTSYRRTYLQNK